MSGQDSLADMSVREALPLSKSASAALQARSASNGSVLGRAASEKSSFPSASEGSDSSDEAAEIIPACPPGLPQAAPPQPAEFSHFIPPHSKGTGNAHGSKPAPALRSTEPARAAQSDCCCLQNNRAAAGPLAQLCDTATAGDMSLTPADESSHAESAYSLTAAASHGSWGDLLEMADVAQSQGGAQVVGDLPKPQVCAALPCAHER